MFTLFLDRRVPIFYNRILVRYSFFILITLIVVLEIKIMYQFHFICRVVWSTVKSSFFRATMFGRNIYFLKEIASKRASASRPRLINRRDSFPIQSTRLTCRYGSASMHRAFRFGDEPNSVFENRLTDAKRPGVIIFLSDLRGYT